MEVRTLLRKLFMNLLLSAHSVYTVYCHILLTGFIVMVKKKQ